MADETYTCPSPFRRREWTGDNLADMIAFTGQEDLRVDASGALLVQMRDAHGRATEVYATPVGWWVRVYLDGAVGVASPVAAEGDVPQTKAA